MYGMNYSGGSNKTHGQIERADRIDSFEIREGGGLLLATQNGRSRTPLWCALHGPAESEVAELSYPGSRWRDTLELSRVRSGFGGSRVYWLCPICGMRARFLYFKGRSFVCRTCATLNYRSQQRTKSSLNHFRDGMKLATETLYWDPPFDVVPMEFPYVTPDRPRYMHEETYRRHLARFRRYQEKYKQDSLREMLVILGRS